MDSKTTSSDTLVQEQASVAVAVAEAPFKSMAVKSLSIFDAPVFKSNVCNPRTGLVNGIVCKADDENNRFIFFLQTGDAHGKDRTTRKAILVAERQCVSKYYIFDVSSITMGDLAWSSFSKEDDPRFVGTFCRLARFQTTILAKKQYFGYTLYRGRHESRVQVAAILFEVASVKAWWKNKHHRSCHLISLGRNNNDEAKNIGTNVILENGCLGKSVKFLLSKEKTLNDIVAPNIGIYVSVTNHQKNERGIPRPTFHGRANQVAAHENMKMADLLTKRTNLHMVVWDDDKTEYNVDFAEPYNAFQAFGFALAQLELGSGKL
jgi:hypothetical protein